MASERTPVTRVGGPVGRGPRLALVAIVVGLLVAIAKPWPGGDALNRDSIPPAPEASPAAVPLVARLLPSPTPAVSDCHPDSGWRVLTIGTDAGGRTETWYPVAPVSAAAALDGSIPTIRIFSTSVERLGYCAAALPAAMPRLDTEAWRLSADGAALAVPLRRADRIGLSRATEGSLFDPPGQGDGTPDAVWPPGRYVFSVRYGPAPADTAWFGAQVMPSDARPPIAPAGAAAAGA